MSENLIVNGTLLLPPVLDLRSAADVKAAFLSARGQALRVDASAVERLGGLGLQILLSAVRTWQADGQDLTFVNVSEALSDQWLGFGASPQDLIMQDAA